MSESWQEDVMIFVNRVADFVHRAVSENDGFPNKNVGDAFQVLYIYIYIYIYIYCSI